MVFYLKDGRAVLVDDEDFDRVSKLSWHASKDGYVMHKIKREGNRVDTIYLHRFVLNARPGFKVDHKNRNPADCQKHNLRQTDDSLNQANSNKRQGTTSSRFKGVYFYRAYGRWKAQLRFNGQRLFLGHFDEEIDAAKAYNVAALQCFGEHANLNPI